MAQLLEIEIKAKKMSYPEKIISIAKRDGIPLKLAKLLAAQAFHETNAFTSNLFEKNLNAFGYKYVGSKFQEGRGISAPKSEGGSYGKYSSLENSVLEITNWIRRRITENRFPGLFFITTPEIYARGLKDCGYYGDSYENYLRGLKNALSVMGIEL